MRTTVVLAALTLAIPAAGQQTYSLTGDHVAIYNLAGSHTLQPTSGSAVTVEVRRGGGDAARLNVDQGPLDGRSTLRVRYPGTRIVYRGTGERGGRFQTQTRVRSDGTFSDRDWTRDRRERGEEVRITSSGSGLEAWADLTIGVPNGQQLSLYTAAGTITVANVNGNLMLDGGSTEVRTENTVGPLSVDIGSGRVEVRNSQGPTDIDTGSGSVTVDGVQGDVLRVDTGSGGVRAQNVTVQRLDVDTGSGSVRVERASARSILIDTGSGGVTLGLTSRPESVEIDTGSGGVTISVPAGYGAVVDIETGSGGIDLDFPVEVQRWSRDHVRGTIGDGQGRLMIDTGSGSVTVRQSGQ